MGRSSMNQEQHLAVLELERIEKSVGRHPWGQGCLGITIKLDKGSGEGVPGDQALIFLFADA